MENRLPIEDLDAKIDSVVQKVRVLKEENNTLRAQVVTLKSQGEAKDLQLAKLEEDLAQKDRQIDEVVAKIEQIVGG